MRPEMRALELALSTTETKRSPCETNISGSCAHCFFCRATHRATDANFNKSAAPIAGGGARTHRSHETRFRHREQNSRERFGSRRARGSFSAGRDDRAGGAQRFLHGTSGVERSLAPLRAHVL